MTKRAGKLARRYAQALLNVARSELGSGRELLGLAEQFKAFTDVIVANPELQASLISPMFDRASRGRVLNEVAKLANLPELGMKLLHLVFERDRVAYLPQIAEAFIEFSEREAKIVNVAVTISSALTDDERALTEQTLRGCIAGNLEFLWTVDPSILGGMIVRYDGNVVDGSISGKLNRLENELLP